MKAPRQAHHRRPGQAARSSWWSPRWRPASWSSRSATSTSAPRASTRPCSSTPPAWSRATTSGSPASRSARSRSVEIVDRTRALVTFTVEDDDRAVEGDPRRHPLPQPGRPALHLADRRDRRQREARRGRHHPGRPDLAGARPDGALQRLQAAVRRRCRPSDINQLSYEIVQVFQGEGGTLEGLLAHTASVTSTLADRDQVIGDADRQPQRGARPPRRPRRPAQPADHDVPHLRRRAQGRPPGDPRLARPDLRRCRSQTADLVDGHPRAVRRATSSSCAASPSNLDRNKAELDRALQVLPIKLDEGRPDRDLRLLVQLLPLPLPGPGHASPGQTVPVRLQHRLATGVISDERARSASATPSSIGAISLAVDRGC